MQRSEKQIEAARRLAAHAASLLQARLWLRLWNGERIALGPAQESDPGFVVRSPGAVARLLRRPKFDTLVQLLAEGEIEIENGTLLDIAARRGEMRTRGMWKKLDKKLLAVCLWPFLFERSTGGQTQAYTGEIKTSVAGGRDDKALIHFHYDLSNEFYALFLDASMVYTCAYFPHWDATLEEAQTAKLEMICRKLRLQKD
ncbi:MAG: SAM-dependent methyltransferase, partial [Alphaproteobacteria bacterium]|nr:SAM-dependent methyltransferase [Alphaproteobacteria bacterium]